MGCAILDPEAAALLAAHGAAVDGQRVRFGEELVARALETAPVEYTVAGRRPELDLRVGLEAPTVLGAASGPALVLDGRVQRHGTLADLRTAIALAHLSPNIAVHGFSVEPTDVPEERRAAVGAHAHLVGSDKGFRPNVSTLDELRVATDVYEILYGAGWYERARLWTIINSTSPLQVSADAAQVLLRLARLGQPICFAVCAMGGTTAPLTPAGLLVVQHAELLCGLVLTQLARPGCPFLYGGTSSIASMQTGTLMMGAPEYWALMSATVRARALAGAAGAGRRLDHRRPRPRRPGRHRVGAGAQDRPRSRRRLRAPRRRHPVVLQLLLAGEVRHRRRGRRALSASRAKASSWTTRRSPST